MVGEWVETTLGALTDWASGGTPIKSNPEYWDGNIPWISASSMKSGRLSKSDRMLTSQGLERGSRLARKGEVLMLVRGSELHKRIPVGVATRDVAFNQDVKALCAKDGIVSSFLYYWLTGNEAMLLTKVEHTGIGAGKLDTDVLKNLPVYLPPIEEQHAIAKILGTLDDKIELNRRTNETLQAMARALFKAWCVDFEPVRAKLEGRWQRGESLPGLPAHLYDLFPARLIESEWGEIPEGWEYVSFGSLLESTIGGDWGKEFPEGDHSEAVSIIRGTDFPDVSSGGVGKAPIRYTTAKKLASRQLQAGDIVVEISGGSPIQPTGRSIFIMEATLERFSNAVVCASFCRRFRPKSTELGVLIFMHLQHIYASGSTWEYQHQSTGIANFQTTYFLDVEMVAIPSAQLLGRFASKTQALLEKISSNENVELVKLRDTLLPKLISGELCVPDAERITGAAL
ncbi:restriction endonuclease subunit S [Xylella fastidiosa]|uniref:restriction endonuclease subunit S n=1 Tax=Xylella fastidiosa TaxID=2371 RepID=UPI00073355D4|nr:restriction endonuclease subunit S [Xylella fastidiosa]